MSPSMDLQLEFCKHFDCCGIQFESLHSLLFHYDQNHPKINDINETETRFYVLT